jgi:hypothetical protein
MLIAVPPVLHESLGVPIVVQVPRRSGDDDQPRLWDRTGHVPAWPEGSEPGAATGRRGHGPAPRLDRRGDDPRGRGRRGALGPSSPTRRFTTRATGSSGRSGRRCSCSTCAAGGCSRSGSVRSRAPSTCEGATGRARLARGRGKNSPLRPGTHETVRESIADGLDVSRGARTGR